MQKSQIDITADNHIHTPYCHHAHGKMEEYVQAAITGGLKSICFLEHLEKGVSYFETTWLNDDEFSNYLSEGEGLQKKYRHKLKIGLGIEIGYNPNCQSETLSFLSRYQWDQIGISYHFLPTADVYHLNMVSRKPVNKDAADRYGVEQVVSDYFRGLLAAVNTLPGTILCHLDAVLRHHPEIRFTSEHHKMILTLLDAIATKGMALEINTSGYRHREIPYPTGPIVREALLRGIKLVAASDAHRPEQVGRYFDRLPDFIANAAIK